MVTLLFEFLVTELLIVLKLCFSIKLIVVSQILVASEAKV